MFVCLSLHFCLIVAFIGNALKEIELLNKLNHENIVAYMGTVVHEGKLSPLSLPSCVNNCVILIAFNHRCAASTAGIHKRWHAGTTDQAIL